MVGGAARGATIGESEPVETSVEGVLFGVSPNWTCGEGREGGGIDEGLAGAVWIHRVQLNVACSKGVPGRDRSAVSGDVDEVVEEVSPQDIGLLEQVGRSQVNAQVVDYHAFGIARLNPLHLHSEVAASKDVPGECLSGLPEGVDCNGGAEGCGLVAVVSVEKGQLEAVGRNQLDEPLEINSKGDCLPRSATAQAVDGQGIVFVSYLQEVVPEYIANRCGDSECVGWRGGRAGLEDATKVGVVGVVGAIIFLSCGDVADIGRSSSYDIKSGEVVSRITDGIVTLIKIDIFRHEDVDFELAA